MCAVIINGVRMDGNSINGVNISGRGGSINISGVNGYSGDSVVISGSNITINGGSYSPNSMIKGSGNIQEQERQIPKFSALRVAGDFRVEIDDGKKPGLTLEGDDNLLGKVETEVDRDGVLQLKYQDGICVSSSNPMKIKISNGNTQHIKMDGAGRVNLKNADNKFMRVDINGSGDVRAQGKTDDLIVRVNGSGDAKLSELKTNSLDAKIMGSGNIDCNAAKSAELKIMGSGDITLSGNPSQISKKIMGSGDIDII